MKKIIHWATKNSPAMNTIMLATLIVGAASLMMMRREVFPEFDMDMVLVSVPYPGATPEEVEEGICQKIEEAVQSLDGIKKQTAVAQEGAGFLVLELDAGVDTQKVLNEVRSEIDQIPSFPANAEDPDVKLITFRVPAIRVGIVGPERDDDDLDAELALRDIAEEVRDDLLQLQPPPPSSPIDKVMSIIAPRKSVVSSANIIGAKPYQIDIEISEETLREYGLTLREVADIVRSQNIELPGGRIKTDAQEMLLLGKNKQVTGDKIAEIEIRSKTTGDVVRVKDLGTVRDAFADETMISRIDGRPGLVIGVDRTSDEDLLKLVEDVKHYVDNKQLPPGYSLRTWFDQSIDVRERMEMLTRNGLQGLLLVFLVLAIFLELRLAFWVALGIPIAILGAGGVLLYGGQTLNMLSMFAFLMALGIVVDDAIVVGENIYQHRQMGKRFSKAAIDGTIEVLPSVFASVSTTIIAFAPLLFVTGIMGKFIAVLPVAVIAMLVISLLESTFILPCHLAHHDNIFFRVLGVIFYPFKFLLDVFRWLNRRASSSLDWTIQRTYLPTLRWSLKNPAVTLCGALALMILAVGLVRSGLTPFNIFPKLDSRFIEAAVAYPNGTPSKLTAEATQRLEQAILAVDEQFKPRNDGKSVLVVRHRIVGQSSALGNNLPGQTSSGSHVGNVSVELVPAEDRGDITSQEILDAWREQAGDFPGVDALGFSAPSMGPGGTPIEFKLLAPREKTAELEAAIEECKAKLATYDGVYDIDDDSRPGKWEMQLAIRDQAKSLGVMLADLAGTVRSSYYGEEVMRLQRGRHEVKLMVRYPRDQRQSLAGFEDIRVRHSEDLDLPITELARVDYERGTSEINRVNQLRSITVSADINEAAGANAREIVADLQKEDGFMDGLLAKYPGVKVRWEGQQEQTMESMQSLFVGLVVALLAMYVLLTMEFRSYFQPLMIMGIIPFGFIGAVIGHAILRMELTMFSLFGLVTLTGVVVNDSIVLMDFINRKIKRGLPLTEALLEAGRRRFRPVLLTSITTIAGLLPILLERSFQAQILKPMAASLCFGLLLATALVLLLIPTYYYVYARMFRRRDLSFGNDDSADDEPPTIDAEIDDVADRDRVLLT